MKYHVVEASTVYVLMDRVNDLLAISGWELAGPLVTHGEGSNFTYTQPMVNPQLGASVPV